VLLLTPFRSRSTPPRLGQRPGLDGVRGLAILGVLVVHAQSFGTFGHFAPGGHLGVTVFFVLSGFLITTLLLEEHDRHGAIHLRHFYLRRAARLLPALLVLLPFHGLVWAFRLPPFVVLAAMLPMLLYVTNLVRAHHLMNLAGTTFGWSLAIEEQFYLGWPPLLKRTLERGRSLLPLAVGCLVAVAVAAGIRLALADDAGWRGWLYYSTVTRFDALFVGCLAALARWRLAPPAPAAFLPSRVSWSPLPVVGWLAAGWLGYAYLTYHAALPITFTLGMPSVALAAALLVLAVVRHPAGWLSRALSHPVLVRLGVLSYGLYLWNLLPFQAWRILSGARPGVAGTLACLAFAYAVAELSYRWVEQPVIGWARDWMRGNRRPLRSFQRRPVDRAELARVHAARAPHTGTSRQPNPHLAAPAIR
jgi:peptidoglycan/LPS O-acetylase OafA/YrhL